MRCKVVGVCAALAAFPLGCGSGEPPVAGGDGRYFPLVVGASWTYRTDSVKKGEGDKRQIIEAIEDVGGRPAFRLRSIGGTDGDTVSWQVDTGSSVVRIREIEHDLAGNPQSEHTFEPGRLRVDDSPERTARNTAWAESYTEVVKKLATGESQTAMKTDRWTVEAVDERVTVPAGTFTTLRVRRVSQTSGSDKTYWFARGVGKVRESGGRIEELVSYDLPVTDR